jgi:hypothetical protein
MGQPPCQRIELDARADVVLSSSQPARAVDHPASP